VKEPIAVQEWVRPVQCGSTNDVAFAWLERFNLVGVYCTQQRSGRGSKGREWFTPPETALAFSLGLVIEAKAPWPHPSRFPYPLAAGVAVCRLVETYAPHAPPKLKWPNDVYIQGGKICGILCESRLQGARCALVLGMGINLRNHPSFQQLGRPLAFLEDWTPLPEPRELAATLAKELLALANDPASSQALRDAWQRWSMLKPGQRLCLRAEGRQLTGSYLGLDENGCLLIETEQGPQRILESCGDFVLEEPCC
jgi:BirA family biotin operon repressor/biotin-[acetyl-CoA-carboxylase] ligase